MKLISMGILLGFGAAVPIGAVNIEMAKRNLISGTKAGLALGFGACSVDLLYLILLFQGVILFLKQPLFLGVLGCIGSLVLFYFSYKAFTAPSELVADSLQAKVSLTRNWFDGFIMTATNPYTIIFWGSISAQVGVMQNHSNGDIYYLAIGLLIGIISWILFFNAVLHHTRKKISASCQHYLNIGGGFILLMIAFISLYNSLNMIF